MNYEEIAGDGDWHHVSLTDHYGVAHFRKGTETPVGDRLLFGEVVARFDGTGGTPDLTLHIKIKDGVPSVAGFYLTESPGGRSVDPRQDSKPLASVTRFYDLVEVAMGAYPLRLDPDGSIAGIMHTGRDLVAFGKNIEGARRKRVDDDRLLKVAALYKAHVGPKPTKAVAEKLGLMPQSAANLVSQARKRGFLPPTTRGRAQS